MFSHKLSRETESSHIGHLLNLYGLLIESQFSINFTFASKTHAVQSAYMCPGDATWLFWYMYSSRIFNQSIA